MEGKANDVQIQRGSSHAGAVRKFQPKSNRNFVKALISLILLFFRLYLIILLFMSKTQNLVQRMKLSEMEASSPEKQSSFRQTKSSLSRDKAKNKYIDLTNLSKN